MNPLKLLILFSLVMMFLTSCTDHNIPNQPEPISIFIGIEETEKVYLIGGFINSNWIRVVDSQLSLDGRVLNPEWNPFDNNNPSNIKTNLYTSGKSYKTYNSAGLIGEGRIDEELKSWCSPASAEYFFSAELEGYNGNKSSPYIAISAMHNAIPRQTEHSISADNREMFWKADIDGNGTIVTLILRLRGTDMYELILSLPHKDIKLSEIYISDDKKPDDTILNNMFFIDFDGDNVMELVTYIPRDTGGFVIYDTRTGERLLGLDLGE